MSDTTAPAVSYKKPQEPFRSSLLMVLMWKLSAKEAGSVGKPGRDPYSPLPEEESWLRLPFSLVP